MRSVVWVLVAIVVFLGVFYGVDAILRASNPEFNKSSIALEEQIKTNWLEKNKNEKNIKEDISSKPIFEEKTVTKPDPSLKITKRIEGPDAVNKLSELVEFSKNLTPDEVAERALRQSSSSNFLVVIITKSKWSGSMSDGSSSVTVSGDSITIIPFSCTRGLNIYNIAIGGFSEDMNENTNLISITIIKNSVIIDGGVSNTSLGLVSLSGDCSNPDYMENMKRLQRQSSS